MDGSAGAAAAAVVATAAAAPTVAAVARPWLWLEVLELPDDSV